MPIVECNDFEQVIVGCKDMHLQIIYKIIFPVKKQLYTLFHLEMHLPFSMNVQVYLFKVIISIFMIYFLNFLEF